ncbi:RodZ domain-containing protein [Bacillus cereus group sp. BfR-BA-01380]|uniref:helix-turn-helix domain-containing protein n=1 Tax=Bacillus cereus group sp. BfR-BA-01380 TaxID=2920324 RepID=UPI001F56729F|nr:RodZ domain-containing protein [Bacillus cereus group sp. BfR-BA-01380]
MTELGQKLKEARELKGLSIDQLQEITKIQKRYLISIEEGNFGILPGDFYARAFIKQYAEAVGLNGEAIVEEYRHEIPQSVSQSVPQIATGQKAQETVQRAASASIADHMPKILITLLVIAVGVAIWFVFQFILGKNDDGQVKQAKNAQTEVEKAENSPLDQKKEKKEEKKEEKKQEVPQQAGQQQNPAQQEIKVVEKNGKESTLELRHNKELKVEITAKGTSYVDIKNEDGKEFYTGTLNKDQTQQQDLSPEHVVRLNIGSAPNVEIKINGQPVEFPQNAEEMRHQILVIKNLGEQPAQ